MDSVLTTVETKVQDAVLTKIENLVISWVELAMMSANAYSGSGVDSVVRDPGRRDFRGKIKGLQMTASSRKNSHTDLNRNDETPDSLNVEGGNFSVDKRNFDRYRVP